jgi:hypothetical protein
VRFWTAHIRDGAEPILVREGFSWGALVFGPFWLLAHQAWVPALLSFAAAILFLMLPGTASVVLSLGLAVFLGVTGHDLCRWSVEHRGYLLVHVLAGRTEAEAFGRLLHARPDLARRMLDAEAAA